MQSFDEKSASAPYYLNRMIYSCQILYIISLRNNRVDQILILEFSLIFKKEIRELCSDIVHFYTLSGFSHYEYLMSFGEFLS